MKFIRSFFDIGILKRGDKVIWWIAILLLVISFLGVISTSTIKPVSSITSVFINYAKDVVIGICAMLAIVWVSYKYYRALTWFAVFLSILFLLMAMFTGKTIDGQNAARWVSLGFFTFQPSAFAIIAMVMFTARYLEKLSNEKTKVLSIKYQAINLWIPVLLMFVLIVPANLSTGLIYITTFGLLLIVGKYPIKHMAFMGALGLVALIGLVGTVKTFPKAFEKSRISTWEKRLTDFSSDEKDTKKYDQLKEAQTAVALGAVTPAGPGKSIQKYFLSQADSDFIFAILVEEYSVVGGVFILFLFVLFVVRCLIQTTRIEDLFGMLIVCGLCYVIAVQAIIHTGVTVGMVPVTGQNLPFISSGGTSIIASCMMVGIIQKIIINSENKTLENNITAQDDDTSPELQKQEQ